MLLAQQPAEDISFDDITDGTNMLSSTQATPFTVLMGTFPSSIIIIRFTMPHLVLHIDLSDLSMLTTNEPNNTVY